MNENKVLTQALEDDFCGVVDVFEALEITISGPAGGYADCFIEVGDNQYRWDARSESWVQYGSDALPTGENKSREQLSWSVAHEAAKVLDGKQISFAAPAVNWIGVEGTPQEYRIA